MENKITGAYGIDGLGRIKKLAVPILHNPLFTTKHYKAIAEVLNGLAQYEILQDVDTLITKEFIKLLEKDNPKFKEKEFIKLVYKS